ncbi:MAG: hypothetical protein U1D55_03590 [Phycisphaerae bacterium]
MKTTQVLTAGLFSILVAAPCLDQAPPQALVELEQRRARLKTGIVDWAHESPGAGTVRYFGSRFTPEESASEYRGDQDGVFIRVLGSGEPSPLEYANTPQLSLYAGGKLWRHFANSIEADVMEGLDGSGGVAQMRVLGITPTIHNLKFSDLQDSIWRDPVHMPTPRHYATRQENGLEVVSTTTDYGELEWYIDPSRDWNAVRVSLSKDGRTLSESRATLAQFDGVWFPERVEYYREGVTGLELVDVVRVFSAEFNRPAHPRSFTPADIGIEPNMPVERLNANHELIARGRWDGRQVISDEEAARRVRDGTLVTGAALAAGWARLEAQEAERHRSSSVPKTGSAANSKEVVTGAANKIRGEIAAWKRDGLWEQFTREVIQRYQLNAEQANRAWDILHDCQQRAESYLYKHRAEFEALQSSMGQEAASRPVRATGGERARLLAPIEMIFEQRLKPRLEQLPTRAQRAAATSHPAAPGR